jgi:opacity protein-like surface antigen
MKKILCVCAALMMAFTAASAFAADVTGSWTGKMVTPNGDGFQITFNFKVDGAKLTGTVAGPQGDPLEITEGKFDGDKLSFNVSFNGMTIKHEGVITGDTIKLTTKTDSDDFPGGEMTLTRDK